MTKEEKRARLEERESKKDAKRAKKRDKYERNIIALVGFVICANAFILSFSGWFIWLALIGMGCCLWGTGKRRPLDYKKYLAYIGLALGFIAIINAIRVSNKWVVNEDTLPKTTAPSAVEETEEGAWVDSDVLFEDENFIAYIG